MFDEQFTQRLLERIGGNSATLVLNNTGQCVFASSNVEHVLGYSREDLVGETLLDEINFFSLEGGIIHNEKNPIVKALQLNEFVQTTPFFCRLSENMETDTLALTTLQILDARNKKTVVVQIRKAKREVQVGEMKSLFVSFAAHQLKTPSSVVKGFLELMLRQGEAAYSSDQWHYLTSAFESNEQLIEVSKTLLNMARLEGGLIEPNVRSFDPYRGLQGKIASFAPLYITKRITVNLSIAENNVADLRNDETFFLEVFGILLGNAIKHSPVAGNITVSCLLNTSSCEVHVIDDGPGIIESVRESLFSSGQESEPNENRHGLGLYMAKKYINLLGGTIGLAKSDKGSDFYFIVPNVAS